MNLIAYRGVAYIEKQVTESVLFLALPLVIKKIVNNHYWSIWEKMLVYMRQIVK